MGYVTRISPSMVLSDAITVMSHIGHIDMKVLNIHGP